MSSISISLQDNKYNIKAIQNSDGSITYQFSTKTYVKNFGEANLSFSMTEDAYGNFISASGSGTVVKDFGLIDLQLEANGKLIVQESNLIGNLEAKASLLPNDDVGILPDNSSITVTELKIQLQIPIEDLQNKNLTNLEIASQASAFNVSTDGPEIWAQDTLWNAWQSMSPEQQATAFNDYGPFSANWYVNINNYINQYDQYMQNIVDVDLDNNILEYFDGTSAVILTDSGEKIVFNRVDQNTIDKYILDSNGDLTSYMYKNEQGEYQEYDIPELSKQSKSGIISGNRTYITNSNGDIILLDDTNTQAITINKSELDAMVLQDKLNQNLSIESSDIQNLYASLSNELGYTYTDAATLNETFNLNYSNITTPLDDFESVATSSNLEITYDENGNFYTYKADGKQFISTEYGTIIQVDSSNQTITIVTGENTGATYTINSNSTLSDEQLGNLAKTFSPYENNIQSDSISNLSLTKQGTNTTISYQGIYQDGQYAGIQTTTTEFTNGQNIQTITTKYLNSIETFESINIDGTIAEYRNGTFQGFSEIDGASVSDAFNQEFIANLKEYGIENPTDKDINLVLSNSSDVNPAIQSAYSKTIANSVKGTDYYGNPIRQTQTESNLQTIGTSVSTMTDALSMIKAIQSGKPLPVAATTINNTFYIKKIWRVG